MIYKNRRDMKMKNNKKGFTLIELLAVIVVLAILMLTAGTSVFNLIADARKNNFRNEFLSLLEAGALQAQMDMMNTGTLPNGSKCYSITCTNGTAGGDLASRWENKGCYNGSVKVTDDGSGKLTVVGWLQSSQLKITREGTDKAETTGASNSVQSSHVETGSYGKITSCGN